MSEKQLQEQIVLNFNNDDDESFIFEDTKLAEAEIRKKTNIEHFSSGEIQVQKYSKVQQRIHYGILLDIQIKNSLIDLNDYEKRAKEIVHKKLKEKKLIDENNSILISKQKYSIAINQERNNLLKKEIPNRYEYSKEQILKIANFSSSNLSYLQTVLNNIKNQSEFIVEELVLDENYENILTNRLELNFFSAFGISSITNDKTLEDLNSPIPKIVNKINFKDMKDGDKLIIEHDINYTPYIIKPNQITPSKKELKSNFIKVLGTVRNFEVEYTLPMYKIAEQFKNIWQNQKFNFKQLQKRFGTKYGIEKELNPKYDSNNPMMKITDKYKKNRAGEKIYKVDENDEYIYEKDYLKKFKNFKRDVLNKAINELEHKTNYKIRIIEIRENGHPLYEYSLTLNELIKRKIAIVNNNTITIGKQKGELKYIQFEITQKDNSKYKNKTKYKNLGYYAAIRIQFYNLDNKLNLIIHLPEFAKKLESDFKENKWKQSILEIETLEDLKLKVEENYDAIIEIKNILNKNYKELSNYSFCEDYLILYDKSTIIKGIYKYKKRLGNDAIQCLNYLYRQYPHLIEDFNKSESKTLYEKILDYCPFEFQKDENNFITITNKNLQENMHKIEIEIQSKNKKSFKAFKQLCIKKEFYNDFFS